jgi:uncharacterized repeat protein (TIGR01451 family)
MNMSLKATSLAGLLAATLLVIAGAATPSDSTGSTMSAWGSNLYGQLGDGTAIFRSTPVQAGVANAVSIAGGSFHSLAVTPDGAVWAWGLNDQLELGNPFPGNPGIPGQVPGVTGATAVAGGYDHALALRSDGTVWAWGDNHNSQIGDGTSSGFRSPVQVVGLTDVVAIAAGAGHSLALRSDGTVWAWGDNSAGQLADGTTTDSNVPILVSGLAGIVAIAGGGAHSLALRSDGTVWAWGQGTRGQLGNGGQPQTGLPVQVAGLTGVIGIAAGGYHSLAVRADGTVWAWGNNEFCQLGAGGTPCRGHGLVPAQVVNLTGITAVAASGSIGYHSLAIKSDGTVWAWGYNSAGQLGDGTAINRSTPVQVSGLSDVTAIATGSQHSLAIVTPPPPVPLAALAPASLDFGTLAVGTTGDAQTATFTNLGPGSLIVSGLNLSGAHADDFLLAPVSLPLALAENASVNLSLSFHPGAAGARSAQLDVVSDASNSTLSVQLGGTGDANADVGVSQSATKSKRKLFNATVTYAITVSNAGPATAHDVQLSDAIPQGATYQSSSTSQGLCTAPPVNGTGTLSCALGSIASNATARVTLVVKVRKLLGLGQLTNTATVSAGAASPDPNPANNSATVTTTGL